MKFERTEISHYIAEELFESELRLIDRAISKRRSHLRSVDELNRRDLAPKQRFKCPTKHKKVYRSKDSALHALHFSMNNRKEAEAAGVEYRFKMSRVYRCGGHWHLTSKPEKASLESFNVA